MESLGSDSRKKTFIHAGGGKSVNNTSHLYISRSLVLSLSCSPPKHYEITIRNLLNDDFRKVIL